MTEHVDHLETLPAYLAALRTARLTKRPPLPPMESFRERDRLRELIADAGPEAQSASSEARDDARRAFGGMWSFFAEFRAITGRHMPWVDYAEALAVRDHVDEVGRILLNSMVLPVLREDLERCVDFGPTPSS